LEVTRLDNGLVNSEFVFHFRVFDSISVDPVPDHLLLTFELSADTKLEMAPLKLSPPTLVDSYDVFSGSATLSDGSPLPTWLNFDATTLRFTFNEGAREGVYKIKYTATLESDPTSLKHYPVISKSTEFTLELLPGEALDFNPGSFITNSGQLEYNLDPRFDPPLQPLYLINSTLLSNNMIWRGALPEAIDPYVQM